MVEQCIMVSGEKCVMPEFVVADLQVGNLKFPLCVYHGSGGVGIMKLAKGIAGGLGIASSLGIVKVKIVPRKEVGAVLKKYGWK